MQEIVLIVAITSSNSSRILEVNTSTTIEVCNMPVSTTSRVVRMMFLRRSIMSPLCISSTLVAVIFEYTTSILLIIEKAAFTFEGEFLLLAHSSSSEFRRMTNCQPAEHDCLSL